MISFMNFMNKRPLDEGEEEQDEKQDEKLQVPTRFMSWQDAIFLLVIAGLVVGGYYFFEYTKNKGSKEFAECSAYFEAKDFLASEACYEKTWHLSYVSDSMEIQRQHHLGYITDMRAIQLDVFEMVESAFLEEDSLLAFEEMKKMTAPMLLFEENHLELWQEWSRLQAIRAAISAASLPSTADSSLQQ